jgi:hypothetical protein
LLSETARSPRCCIVFINNECLEGNGMGGLTDAEFWGVAWAIFAAAAGVGLAVAARASCGRSDDADEGELAAGYNALAPMLDR